jgi:FlaA1/EpsC-like NDP-sugar epimerase
MKILITGGTGTVGKAFINEYYNDYKFYNISRSEIGVTELLREFPNVTSYIGNICDLDHMINMFSKRESAKLIYKALESATLSTYNEPFILCKMMKNVNLLELANVLSDKEIEIIGKRPGEKLNETLVSEKELPFTRVVDDYVYIFHTHQSDNMLTKEHSSVNADRMSVTELKELIWN